MTQPPRQGALSPADSEWGQNRMLARSLLIKSRLYRFFALAFALMGVVVFITLFFRFVEGQFFTALRDPSIIAMITIPFLPAVVLSLMAQKTEQKFAKLGKSAAAGVSAEGAGATTSPASKKQA